MTPGVPDPGLAGLLYEALGEPIGLLCQAEPTFEKGRQRLYQTRARLGDPALEGLQFRASPFEGGNLVIVKDIVKVGSNGEKV